MHERGAFKKYRFLTHIRAFVANFFTLRLKHYPLVIQFQLSKVHYQGQAGSRHLQVIQALSEVFVCNAILALDLKKDLIKNHEISIILCGRIDPL